MQGANDVGTHFVILLGPSRNWVAATRLKELLITCLTMCQCFPIHLGHLVFSETET